MMRIFTLLFSLFVFSALQAQVIWGGPGDANSEFDGGLNDWTTNGFSMGTANENAVWTYKANSNASEGAYASDQAIESASTANGAMVFNSDFLDTDGTQGAFGSGAAPAPQIGYLTSPVISTTGEDAVTLQFNSYYRTFMGAATVEVTNDGGDTWTSYSLYQTEGVDFIDVNEATRPGNITFVDISDTAADQDEIQFRFVFSGDFYFWIVDDVQLIVTPGADLRVTDVYYPVNARLLPIQSTDSDTLEFVLDVISMIGSDEIDGEATVTIEDAAGTELYSATEAFTGANSDTITTIVFDDVVLPADASALFSNTGAYNIFYNVERNDGVAEIYEDDNTFPVPVEITSKNYQLGVGTRGVAWAQDEYTIGSIFYMGDLPDNWYFAGTDISMSVSQRNVTVMEMQYETNVYEVDAGAPEDIFDTANGGLDETVVLADQPILTSIGYGFGDESDMADTNEATVFSIHQGPYQLPSQEELPLELKPNTKYIVATQYTNLSGASENFMDVGANQGINYYQTVNILSWGAIGTGIPTPDIAFNQNLEVEGILPDGTFTPEFLDDVTLEIFPNPASDQISINTLLPNTEDKATFSIYNMEGKMLTYKTVYDLQEGTQTFDVSEYPSGQYMVKFYTNKGIKTEKFAIIR